MITETYDLRAPVPPPQEQDYGAYLASIQSAAGFLVGKLDWVAKTFCNFSPLEELVKPLCGDWTRLEYAALGFDALEAQLDAVGQNLQSGADQVGSVWTGAVASQAQFEVRTFAGAHYQQAQGCKILAEQLRHICEVSKAAGEALATGLGVIGEILTQLLIENSIPVFGNAFSAATIGQKLARFFAAVRPILLNISKVVKVISIATGVIDAIKQVMANITLATRVSIGFKMDDTSKVLFGV